MNNNILRTQKVKTRGQITQASEHNFRLREQHNIDASRTKNNQILVNSLGVDTSKASDLQEKLTAYYEKLGVKERKDSVLMMEFIVSASPEFFAKKNSDEVKKWADDQTQFFKKKFGDGLKIGVLHLDEKTEHIHFMVSTEQKSVKKYKNQKGEFFKETYSLNAKRFDRQFLIDLHSEHAEHNKKWGLKRGVKGSMRKHTTLKEFYKVIDQAMSADYSKEIEKVLETLETGILSKKVSIEEVREKFSPWVNKITKQNKALREKFALDLKTWAEEVQERDEELKVKEAELKKLAEVLESKKERYLEAINYKDWDSKRIFELEQENIALRAEVNKYEPNSVSESSQSRVPKPKFMFKAKPKTI